MVVVLIFSALKFKANTTSRLREENNFGDVFHSRILGIMRMRQPIKLLLFSLIWLALE